MKTLSKILCLAGLALPSLLLTGGTAEAQDTGTPQFTVHDRARGELSPDAQAPTREQLMAAIDSSSPSALAALLEYGERVECHQCVPLLQRRMLDPNADASVREMAAWWLRHRPFGFGAIMHETRVVLETDANPARRAAAADAIGEFMDPHGVAFLTTAFETDADLRVQVAAVRGLARINSPEGLPVLRAALEPTRPVEVIEAALRSVLQVNFFRPDAELLALLGHESASVRRRAAYLVGTLAVDTAVTPLSAMVIGDTDVLVRQAAAWALGRIGTPAARTALGDAAAIETSRRVLDAIEVARAMR
jgi:hypothetical protein